MRDTGPGRRKSLEPDPPELFTDQGRGEAWPSWAVAVLSVGSEIRDFRPQRDGELRHQHRRHHLVLGANGVDWRQIG